MFPDLIVNKDITLTRYKYRYAYELVNAMSDVTIYNNILKIPFPYFISDALFYIGFIQSFEKKNGLQKEWAITHQKKLIGAIGLHYDKGMHAHVSEIGYWLHKEYRGNGWMTDILKVFANHVFKTSSLQKLKATVFDFNKASAISLERAGFVREGLLHNEYEKDQKLINGIPYAICK